MSICLEMQILLLYSAGFSVDYLALLSTAWTVHGHADTFLDLKGCWFMSVDLAGKIGQSE